MKFQLIYRKSTFFPNSWERKKTTLRLICVTIYKCLQILSFDVRILASIFGYSVQLQNPKIVIPSLNGFVVRFCQPGGVDKKSYLCKSRDQSMAKRCCRKIGKILGNCLQKYNWVLFYFFFIFPFKVWKKLNSFLALHIFLSLSWTIEYRGVIEPEPRTERAMMSRHCTL